MLKEFNVNQSMNAKKLTNVFAQVHQAVQDMQGKQPSLNAELGKSSYRMNLPNMNMFINKRNNER